VLVVVGDSVPHEPAETLSQMKTYNRPNPRSIDWREQLNKCWENGFKVCGVQTNPTGYNGGQVKYFYDSAQGAQHTSSVREKRAVLPLR